MKPLPISLAIVLATGLAHAQDLSSIRERYIATTPFHVSLVHDVSSAKSKVNDTVELRYFGEIKVSGEVVLGSKARLFGRITESVKRDRTHPQARLAIRVDHAVYDGKTLSLNLVFCGNFFKAPHMEPTGVGRPSAILPESTGLPTDARLVASADPNVEAVLVSETDNINLSSDTSFFICELQPKPPLQDATARRIVVPASLPSGVRLPVTLRTALDARKVQAGQEVEMSLISDLLGPDNTIAIPSGALITGKVLGAVPGSKGQESQLSIVAESAKWQGGTVPLHAYPNDPPLLGSEVLIKMTAHLKDASIDLRGINVVELSQGGKGFARANGNIQLPVGTVLLLQQAD